MTENPIESHGREEKDFENQLLNENSENPDSTEINNANSKKKSNFKIKKPKKLATSHSKLHAYIEYNISNPFKRYISLVEKEIRVLVKDKAAMMIMYAIPLVVLLILTVGVSQDTGLTSEETGVSSSSSAMSDLMKGETPIIGLIDLDDSDGFPNRDLSSELMQKFIEQEELGTCTLYISQNQTELEQLLGEGKISAFLIIPKLFEFNLSIHIPVIVPFVIDSLNLMGLQTSQSIVEQVILDFRVQNDFTGVFKTHKYNVNLPEKAQILYAASWIMFPLLIFGIGNLTSTQSIVADIPKDRMVLTPTNKKEIMAAKVTALQILMSGLILIFIIACAIAGFQIRSTWFDFFIVLSIISLNAVIIGVAISAISQTSLSAFQYFIFLFIFQTIVLIFVEDPLILNLMPVHNGAELVMGIILRGQTYYSERDKIYNLLMESAVVYLISYWIFKKQKTML